VLFHECQFGLGLRDLRRDNLPEGGLTLRQRLLILLGILLALTAPFQSFEFEIAIVQRTQHLPLVPRPGALGASAIYPSNGASTARRTSGSSTVVAATRYSAWNVAKNVTNARRAMTISLRAT
jgi:hypothetical protein